MTETQRNSSPVTFREFDDHRRSADKAHESVSGRVDRNDQRIDDLEAWRDRIAGPTTFLLVSLTVAATVSSLLAIWMGILS